MKKFKVIEAHHLLEEGTIVIDEGINQVVSDNTGKEHRDVLIDGNVVPITYSVPIDKLEELNG